MTSPDLDSVFETLRRQVLALGREFPDRSGTVRADLGQSVLTISWEPGSSRSGAALPDEHTTAPAPTPSEVNAPAPTQARSLSAPAPTEPSAPAADLYQLTAQTVGVFYASPEPGRAPFVESGDPVRAGQQIAIVEAMKLMIPVECDRDGTIVEMLVDNGAPVEYGQPLFTVRLDAHAREAA